MNRTPLFTRPLTVPAAALWLSLSLSACHLPSWQTGQLRVATRFAVSQIQSESLRIQAIPAESSAIAVAVFKPDSQGSPEQSVLLTPEHASHELGQLEPGPRRVLALAFDSAGNLLAGSSGQAQVLAGQTSQLSLELSTSFKPDAAELAKLKALLPKIGETPLTGTSQSSQSTNGQSANQTSGTTQSGGQSPSLSGSQTNGPATPSGQTSPPANLPQVIDSATGQLHDSAGAILDPASQTVDTVLDSATGTVGNVVNATTGTVGTVSETAGQVVNGATDSLDEVVDTVDQVVDETVDSVDDTVGEVVNDTVEAVASVVPSVIPSIVPSIVPSILPSIIPNILPTPTPRPSTSPTPSPSPTPKSILGIKLPI